MTTANPLYRQPPARQRAPRADRVHRILRARRRETAAAGGAEKKNLCRRNRQPTDANGEKQTMND
jgi:hypothetical protein